MCHMSKTKLRFSVCEDVGGGGQEKIHPGQVWSWGSSRLFTSLDGLSPTLQPTFSYKYSSFTTQPLYTSISETTRKEVLSKNKKEYISQVRWTQQKVGIIIYNLILFIYLFKLSTWTA